MLSTSYFPAEVVVRVPSLSTLALALEGCSLSWRTQAVGFANKRR
jgi:hypothetical protein